MSELYSSPLDELEDDYDTLIVGGGIVGAGIFRDLSLHGVKCLLIDKKDFTSQTSQSSSKMLHGGIRYLEKLNFDLVWEALHEKNLWLGLAPHLCYESPFYFPVFKGEERPLWMIKAGLSLYDFLSSYRNTPHKILSKKEALKAIPSLKEKGLRGAGVYYDAIVDDAKLTLEVIYDALKGHGQAFNHVEMNGLDINSGEILLRDCLNQQKTKKIKTKDIVVAVGPFTDILMGKILDWEPILAPSKGSHLWLKPKSLPIKDPLLLKTHDERVFFVIPWPNAILVGTTETKVEGELFDLKASPEEIDYLLNNIKKYFPEINLGKEDIISTFSGVRPLIKGESNGELGEIKREHKVYQPRHNIHVIAGGKYTTFRTMGQEISRKIVLKNHLPYNSNLTKKELRQTSIYKPFQKKSPTPEEVFQIIKREKVRTFEDLLLRRLGFPTPEHWTWDTSFEDFFRPLYPELKKLLFFSDSYSKYF
ncbi:FAD-dependent oxidoreductase [Bacteriovoracales bacterium]|nr:FAD-dependent oxidoreductase [Bacteriovoracales bacterium]